MRKHTYWWVWIVVIINVSVYIIEWRSGLIGNSDYLVSIGAFRRGSIQGLLGYYRLFSCQFIHGGLFHLLANMSALIYISKELKGYYSSLQSLGIYIFGIFFVGIAVFLFGREGTTYIGNSGAICALISSWVLNGIIRKKKKKLLKKEFELLSVIIISTLLIPGISPIMHFAGLLGGAVTSIIKQKVNIIL